MSTIHHRPRDGSGSWQEDRQADQAQAGRRFRSGQRRCSVNLHLLTTCYSELRSLPADATVLKIFHRDSTQTLIVCFRHIHHVVMVYIIPGILYE